MKVLTNEEVVSHLGLHLKNWTLAEESINRDFKFRNFIEAFSFMTAVALEAEKMDHHPEWNNVFNKVNVKLSTHQPKGITQQDMDLASKIDAIYTKME